MNLDQIVNVVALLVVATGFLIPYLSWIQAHTHNQRVKALETWALQIMRSLNEAGSELTPEDKQKEAEKQLVDLINQGLLKVSVTDNDIKRYINNASNILKKEG